MEIQVRLFHQRAEIDVHRPTETIPARKTILLFAVDISERIADVLKIETDTASCQPCSLAAPFTEKMAVRALTRLMAVWAAKSFFWCLALQIHRHRQHAKARARQEGNTEDSRVHRPTTRAQQAMILAGSRKSHVAGSWKLEYAEGRRIFRKRLLPDPTLE